MFECNLAKTVETALGHWHIILPTYQNEQEGHCHVVEDAHAAVNDPELLVDVEVGNDARDDPGDVKDVQN